MPEQPPSRDKLIEYLEFMLNKFRPERYVYLALTILSFLLLLYGFCVLIGNPQTTQSALTMLAPTGLITMAIYRVVKFWNDCLKIVRDQLQNQIRNGRRNKASRDIE